MLCLTVFVSMLPAASFANETGAIGKGGIIAPRWAGVKDVYSDISFKGGQANVLIDIDIDTSKANKVNFTGNLQKNENGKWKTIKSWNDNRTVDGSSCIFNQSYDVQKGYEYKFVATAKAYKGSSLVDTINIKSPVKKY